MKNRKILYKAGVLLIALVMVLSVIPAITAEEFDRKDPNLRELLSEASVTGINPDGVQGGTLIDGMIGDDFQRPAGDKGSFLDLFSEDFETGTFPMSMTVVNGGGADYNQYGYPMFWEADSAWAFYHTSECASIAYGSGSSGAIDQDDWLITPSINCLGYDNIELEFFTHSFGDLGSMPPSPTEHNFIKVSNDGGSTWVTVDDLSHGHGEYHNTLLYDISTWADNEPDVKIAFHRTFGEPWTNYCTSWWVDDIKVSGLVMGQPFCDFFVEINSPTGIVNSFPQIVNVTVGNLGIIPIGEVKKLVDIYEKICGDTIEIFNDDMEDYECFVDTDNENWTSIDNGDGDSWVLQEDCFHSPGQAYRNTWGKYRDPCAEDTYLGRAANSSNDELVLASYWNLTGAACAEISFWHQTNGEFAYDWEGNVVPIDYGTIALSYDNGTTWEELPISDFVAYDNVWDKVTIHITDLDANGGHYDLVCDDCACDEDEMICINHSLVDAVVKIKFIWHTDPCLQFYGWCIDDVVVTRTQPYSLDLVFQTHSIQDIPGGYVGYEEFPLEFDPEPNTWYQIDVCGQVFIPDCETEFENNCDSVQFYVADLHDVAAIDIECPDFIELGDNGEFTVTVKNVGNFIENNVPVELQISPLMSTTYLDESFESGVYEWVQYYFSGHNLVTWWDVRNVDASAGEYSLMIPDVGLELTPSIDCIATDDITYDFSQGGSLKWNMKWSLAEGDYFRIYAHNPEGLYWFGIRDPAHYGTYSNDFLPQEWDIIADIYDYIWATWPSYAPDHFPTPIMEIAFGMDTDASMVHLNPDNPEAWSGVMIDEVVIGYEFCSSDQITVDTYYTGVLEPGDEETFTMYWNNTEYCHWCICADTQLASDVNTSNDEICCNTLVASTSTEVTFETDDLTDIEEDTLWHICCKHSFDPEPPRDCYYWNGFEFDTYGYYLPNTDDSLVSCIVNLTTYADAVLIFDTWYRFNDTDFGEIYVSGDNGTTWILVGAVNGVYDTWHDVVYYIPPAACTNETLIRFRMVSNDEGESDGWYIDDVRIGTLLPGSPFYSEDFGAPAPITPIFTENFEGGYGQFTPVSYEDGTIEFLIEPYGMWGNDPIIPEGMLFAGADSDRYPGSDMADAIITTAPIVIPAGTSGVAIDFSSYFWNWLSGDLIYVLVHSTAFGFGGWSFGSNYGAPVTGLDLTSFIDVVNGDTFLLEFYYDTLGGTYDGCMNIDDIVLGTSTAVPFPPAGWQNIDYNGAGFAWQQALIGSDSSDPPSGTGYYAEADSDEHHVALDCGLITNPIDMSMYDLPVTLELDSYFQVFGTNYAADDVFAIFTYSNATDMNYEEMIYYQDWDDLWPGQHLVLNFNPSIYTDPSEVMIEFWYVNNIGTYEWFANIDNIQISDNAYAVDFLVDDFEGDYCEWTGLRTVAGNYWEETTDLPNTVTSDCDGDGDVWFVHEYPEDGLGLNNVLDVTVNLTNTELTYVDLTFSHTFMMEEGCSYNIEIAGDDLVFETIESLTAIGGYVYNSGWDQETLILTEYIGQTVTIRFRYTTPGEGFTTYSGFGWAVDCFEWHYKEMVYTDELPPVTVACFDEASGTVTLFAQDQAGPVVSGVCATYYILNGGAETLYEPGDVITLSEGTNTLEFWSVDCADNEELPHNEKTFRVDTTAPTISITAPEEGALYLFGNKIMNRILGTTTLCIGKVTIEAQASDAGGISMVVFEIDGDSGYDPTAPYEYTYRGPKFGSVTATATAFDMAGLDASDSTTFNIYCLGLF